MYATYAPAARTAARPSVERLHPIEEEGGINLYGFVGNDSVASTDYLGLVDCDCGKVEIRARAGLKGSGHDGGWFALRPGDNDVNTISADTGYEARLVGNDCASATAQMELSPQPDDEDYLRKNPGNPRPKIPSPGMPIDNISSAGGFNFNNTIYGSTNAVTLSKLTDYTILKDGEESTKQAYVKLTIKGYTGSEHSFEQLCCTEVYWIRGKR